MTEREMRALQTAGAEISMDRVTIPHPHHWNYKQLLLPVLTVVSLLPLQMWNVGALPAWAALLYVLFWLAIVWLSNKLQSQLSVTPAHLALETRFRSTSIRRQIIPWDTIGHVQVLKPEAISIDEGSLMLHLTNGSVIRIYPCQNSHDARMVGAWLEEVASNTNDIEAGVELVPAELRRVQRRSDTSLEGPQ